ncbi:MAG: DMT family transporter, partial [Rhodospirillales bacterium]
LLLLAVIWSSSFMAIKVGVETIPPMTLAAVRVIVAAAALCAAARVQGARLPGGSRFWVFCFLLGIVGNGLPFTLIGWGEVHISSGLAAILMSVMPLATVVMAHFFTRGDRMTPAKLIGVVVGFAGIVILVGPEALKDLGGDVWRQLAVAGGALCYAIAVILARNTPPSPLIARSAAVMIMASLVMTPAALVAEAPWAVRPAADSLAAAVYLGLFPTAFATIIFFHLVQSRGASFMAFVNYLIPVFGVIWGAVTLGEQVAVTEVTALIVILAGMAIARYGRSPTAPRWMA